MKSTTNPTGLLSFSLALALGLALPAALAPRTACAEDKEESGTDTVYTVNKEGKTIAKKGEIVEDAYAKIVLKQGEKNVTIKREEIQRIEYGGLPSGLNQADGLLAKGNDFDAAAAAYRKVAEDSGTRAIFKMRAFIGLGRALAGAGKFEDAAAAYQSAIKAPTGNLLLDAVRECVRSLNRGKMGAKALVVAREAKATFRSADLPEEAQDWAQLLEAESLEASGQAGEARSKYNVLTNSKDPKVKGTASLGVARTAFDSKEYDRAEGAFRSILDQKDIERSVRCGAAVGLGNVLVKKLGNAKDFQKLRAAATAYAQALAVHFPGRGEPTDSREQALHECAKVYDALADLCVGEKDAKGKELYQSEARQLREELVRLYKTSQFRQENEQKLAKGPQEPSAETPKAMKTTK